MSKLFRVSVRRGNRFLVLSMKLLRALNKVDFYAGARFLEMLLKVNDAKLAPEHFPQNALSTTKLLTYAPDSVQPNNISRVQSRCLKWFLDGFRELDEDMLTSIEFLDYGVRKILS